MSSTIFQTPRQFRLHLAERSSASVTSTSLQDQKFKGRVHLLHAYEVGHALHLDQASERLGKKARPLSTAPTTRAPPEMDFDPQPLVWQGGKTMFKLFQTEFEVAQSALLYDFGSISVQLCTTFEGTFAQWRDLCAELEEKKAALVDTTELVARTLFRDCKRAIERRRFRADYESYFIIEIDPAENLDVEAFTREFRLMIAQLLNREKDVDLHEEEIDRRLERGLSYTKKDRVFIHWRSALVVDHEREFAVTRAILDFANVKLLELEQLDRQTERALNSATRMARSPWMHILDVVLPFGFILWRLNALKAQIAFSLRSINNPISLTNDLYVAHLLKDLADCFHYKVYEDRIRTTMDEINEITHSPVIALLERFIFYFFAYEIIFK